MCLKGRDIPEARVGVLFYVVFWDSIYARQVCVGDEATMPHNAQIPGSVCDLEIPIMCSVFWEAKRVFKL